MFSLFSHCVNTPEGSIILKEAKGVSSSLIELKWHSRLLLIQRKQKVKPGFNIQYLSMMKKKIAMRRPQDYFYNVSEVISSRI